MARSHLWVLALPEWNISLLSALALEGKDWAGVQDMQSGLKGREDCTGSKFMNTLDCGV